LISVTASFKRWQARREPFHPNARERSRALNVPSVFRCHPLKIFLHTAAQITAAEVISIGSTPGKYVQAPSLLAGFSGAMPLH
jgi:hypothetical protein